MSGQARGYSDGSNLVAQVASLTDFLPLSLMMS